MIFSLVCGMVVPLINEVFHTSYPEDVKIVHLRNEHQLEDGELITDARLLIGDKKPAVEPFLIKNWDWNNIRTGMMRGKARLSALIKRLILDGRSDEIQKVATDADRKQELYSEYKL